MRIGIDAREITGHPTGVGRYLAGVLQRWNGPEGRGHEYVLYAHRPPVIDGLSMPVRLLPGGGGTVWEQTTLARAVGVDGCHALYASGYTAPLLSRVPTAVIIHDISFVAHPEWFTRREGWRRRLITRRTAAQARAVITVSQFSRGEIMRHFGTSTAKIHVIPPAIDPPAAANRTPSSPDREARILYVGSIFNRRHVPTLIDAAAGAMAVHPSMALDLVGDNRTYPRIDIAALIERQPARARMRWHRYVSDAELRHLYGAARTFAYLSEYEGFGLTPLEALSIGIPPLLLDTPAGRETCGDAALFVPAGDTAAISHGLIDLLFDEPTRARILAAAPAVLSRYSWQRTAAATLDVIEGLL